jgi:hypothetical protein
MQLAISRLHSFYSNATLLSQPAGAQWEPWLQGAALVKQAFAVAWQHFNLYGRNEFRKQPEARQCGRNRSGIG